MKRDEIITTINDILVEEFEVDRAVIIPEADFRESLGLDSLDYVDLVVVIQETQNRPSVYLRSIRILITKAKSR